MKTQQGAQINHPGLWQSPRNEWPELASVGCHPRNVGLQFQRMLPQLAELAQRPGWVVLINPPAGDLGSLLRGAGIEPQRVLKVRCGDDVEAQWALEQAMVGGTCSLALAWLPSLASRDQRRLQLVQKRASCPAILFHGQGQAPLQMANPVH